MKITNEKLKKIIQEELENVLNELESEEPINQPKDDALKNITSDSDLYKSMTDTKTDVVKAGGSKTANKDAQEDHIRKVLTNIFTNQKVKAKAFKFVQELMKQNQ